MTNLEFLQKNLSKKDFQAALPYIPDYWSNEQMMPVDLTGTEDYLSNPLSRMFKWASTPEGHKYWKRINDKLLKKYLNKKLVLS